MRDGGETFEAWFGSSADYEEQRARGLVACPLCGSGEVAKAPMAPAEAVRTLIRWAGDDPDREGCSTRRARVARAWREYARGYAEDPAVHLSRTFEEVGGYDEIVLLKDIPFQSHCEHHLAPIIGKASIAYLPRDKVVGISKLARVLHGFARRLQVQERLTAQVADCIWEHLQPKGVAVVIEASHACMTARGVNTPGVMMTTSRMMGKHLPAAQIVVDQEAPALDHVLGRLGEAVARHVDQPQICSGLPTSKKLSSCVRPGVFDVAPALVAVGQRVEQRALADVGAAGEGDLRHVGSGRNFQLGRRLQELDRPGEQLARALGEVLGCVVTLMVLTGWKCSP
jgi:GTP cyclohydrolase I